MKRILCMVLILTLAVTAAVPAFAAKANKDGSLTLDGTLKAPWTIRNDSELYELNPVTEGENLMTGLPASGNSYTPIVMVLDNAGPNADGTLAAFPHWGVEKADIIFQVPNAGYSATKLMALFTDEYPEECGGARSGRTGFYPIAKMFDAAFLFFGAPGTTDNKNADMSKVLASDKDMLRNKKWFDLINGKYTSRVDNYSSPHNVSVRINEIHQELENLVSAGEVSFNQYAFEFTDEPRTEGKSAEYIEIDHIAKNSKKSNPASYATFTYVPEKGGYIRTNSSGDYRDGLNESGEPIIFTNVIVLRTALQSSGEYVWEKNFMVNSSGVAEIFQNGKYVRGAWSRNKDNGCRLLLTEKVGKKVQELQLQRGKTFIVISNDTAQITIK